MTLNNKKTLSFLIVAVFVAAILSFCLKSPPLDEQFINLSVEQNLSYFSDVLDKESSETKAILLDYADNQELVLKTWIALKKYPHTAEQIFFIYDKEPEFQKIILKFGEDVIPVIDYFMQNEITSLTVQKTLGNLWQALQDAVSPAENDTNKNIIAQLTPQQRGGYAIIYINQDGYNFLGQFAIDRNGNAQWIQTDRVTKALVNLFTSGIRDIEKKYKTNEEITNGDILWAGVDVFALSSIKLLKASKAVSASKELSSSKKLLSLTKTTSVFSAKLIKNKTVQSLLKYSTIATTLYITITHPSLINSMLDCVANLLGMNPEIVKMLSWTIIIFLLLYPFLWLFNSLVRPLVWVIRKIGYVQTT
jgi:hypothetical protein